MYIVSNIVSVQKRRYMTKLSEPACTHTSRFLDPRTDVFPSTLTAVAAMAAIDNAIFIFVVD